MPPAIEGLIENLYKPRWLWIDSINYESDPAGGGKESFSVKKYNIHEKNNDSNQLLKGDSYTHTHTNAIQ